MVYFSCKKSAGLNPPKLSTLIHFERQIAKFRFVIHQGLMTYNALF